MGLYQKINNSFNDKQIENYEEIIKEINYFYTKYKTTIVSKKNISDIINEYIKQEKTNLNEYLTALLEVPSYKEKIANINKRLNGIIDSKNKSERNIIPILDNNIRYIKQNATIKYGEDFVQEAIKIENKYRNLNLDDIQLKMLYIEELYKLYPDIVDTKKLRGTLFASAITVDPKYQKMFSIIKSDVDKQIKLGTSFDVAINTVLINKNITLDLNDMIQSIKKSASNYYKELETEKAELMEDLSKMLVQNAFALETERLRKIVKEKIEYGIPKEDTLKDILPQAYGLVKLACEMSIGMKPYDVQIMGAIAMNEGKITEMYTGEGKTLTAILPAYLNSLAGGEVDIFTPNDYLADRDAKKNEIVFKTLGLTVGCVKSSNQTITQKKEAYKCDIVYGSSTAFAFDFLYDTNENDKEKIVQRTEKPDFVIIDEADQILINNALSPYCLSSGGKPLTNDERKENENILSNLRYAYAIEQRLSKSSYIAHTRTEFENLIDYTTSKGNDASKKYSIIIYKEKSSGNGEIFLTEKGYNEIFYYGMHSEIDNLTQRTSDFFKKNKNYILNKDYVIENEKLILTLDGLLKATEQTEEFYELKLKWLSDEKSEILQKYVNNALTAQYLMEKGRSYQVGTDIKTGKSVVQVLQDGRIMPDSHFRDGIHEALALKEGLDITPKSNERLFDRGLAEISNRALIYRYSKRSGMTGTADKSAFFDIYGMDTFVVPRHKQYQYEKNPDTVKKPIFRNDKPTILYERKSDKINAIIDELIESHRMGQPVLIVVDSVEEATNFYNKISKIGLSSNLLIADRNLEEENQIISEAGKLEAITIATEMAGRGTDIKLGGEKETNKNKIRDDILRSEAIKHYMEFVMSTLPHSLSIEEKKQLLQQKKHEVMLKSSKYLEYEIQKLNSKYRKNFEYRKNIDKQVDARIEKIVKPVIDAGGLNYIQMNPFKTTRNDNQGKGRVGRQGEPGSTRIYACFEDLANLGVDLENIRFLKKKMNNNSFITDKELDGKISETIENAQSINEYNMDLSIAQTDTVDLAVSSIGMILFKAKKEITKKDDVSSIFNNMINSTIKGTLKECVGKRKEKKLDKDNYRLSRVNIDMDGLKEKIESIFEIEINSKEIFSRCTDVGDLKALLREKVELKMRNLYKNVNPQNVISMQRDILLSNINETYAGFMDGVTDIQRQIINDQIAQNSSKNRLLEITQLYKNCRQIGWNNSMREFFRVKEKKKSSPLDSDIKTHLDDIRGESESRIRIFNSSVLNENISLNHSNVREMENVEHSRKK